MKRRWHSVRRDGPGRMRIKIAAMLRDQFQIEVRPEEIHCNGSPSDRWFDMCRWCVDGTDANGYVHVCSWDRMGDILRSKKLCVVNKDRSTFEVCAADPDNGCHYSEETPDGV